MTVADQVTFAKRLARNSGNAATETYTDDVARFYVNEGVREFCKATQGISAEEYLTVAPTFNTRTNFAIRLTIVGGANAIVATDIVITAADADRTTGTAVASALETAIQAAGAATATVTWSTTAWTFTIDAIDSTSITIEAPTTITYVDATEMLFGTSGTQTGTTFAGSFPEDCTVRASLPTDFMSLEYIEWDDYPLRNAPFSVMMSPETYGDPAYYHIQDKYIYFNPSPNTQKLCKIQYEAFPASATLTGSSDTADCPLAVEYHMAPVFYSASMLLSETFENDEGMALMAKFIKQTAQYVMQEANQNPKMFPRSTGFRQPTWKDERSG